jgi:hypothetical protein
MTMKHRKFLALAFAVLLTLAFARPNPNLPLKLKDASPEMRALYGFPDIPDPPAVDIETLRKMAGQDAPKCATVTVSPAVNYRGRKLVEIPDITEPELRLANQLLSSGCYARAVSKLEGVLRANPDNRNANYIIARMSWQFMDTEGGEQETTRTLTKYPDFVSAKVLLAGIRFEQNNLPEMARLLDEVEARSPTDLWIYMNRLRVETFQSPSRDLYMRLLEIMRNPAFPPNAREHAGDTAKYLSNLTPQELDGIYTSQLDITDSNQEFSCKATEYAFWLSESQKRYDDVIKLLESPRAKAGRCSGIQPNRVLLAQAYLMNAAKISPHPGPANQKLLDKADAILNGDFTGISSHVTGRPQAAMLAPFLAAYVHPDEMDSAGETMLCRGIEQFDVALVVTQLEAGSDPNGTCRGESLVGSLVFMATVNKDEQRRDMMRALLAHGAPLKRKELEVCRSKDNGDCSEVMLPVMEKYASRAK